MRRGANSTQFAGVCLALGLGAVSALAQGHHLDALRDWMGHTEEAAKLVDKRDYVKAEQRLNAAIRDIRPYFPDTKRNLARSYCELARVLYHQKRYAEAEPLARWALAVRDSDKNARPESVFQCVYTLGMIESALKHAAEAERLFKRSLELQEKSLGRDHVNSLVILDQLANLYTEQAKYADAERLYLRSIAIHERKTADENLALADTAEKFAALLRRVNRTADAERWHARALAIRDFAATKAAKAKSDRVHHDFQGFK